MRERDEFKISFCYLRGLRVSPQTYCERGRWRNLMCVYSVKLMAVGFCSIDATLGLCYSGDGCGNCLSFAQYLETGASKEYQIWHECL